MRQLRDDPAYVRHKHQRYSSVNSSITPNLLAEEGNSSDLGLSLFLL